LSDVAALPSLDFTDLTAPSNPKATAPREFFIHGLTVHGRTFRPSDWAERLCGVMSCYRPGGIGAGRDAFIGYSPYVRPTTIGGVKCVIVDERLRGIERMAFDFVMNFAKDNELQVFEGCSLPDRAPK
jgi:hypothetical protein